jgi:hypothetical protein
LGSPVVWDVARRRQDRTVIVSHRDIVSERVFVTHSGYCGVLRIQRMCNSADPRVSHTGPNTRCRCLRITLSCKALSISRETSIPETDL